MVFSSVPAYLDPPNWNQQAYQSANGSGGRDGHQHPQLGTVVLGPESGMPGTIRPLSMAERARIAKIPQPGTALKCPRCDSTNTKFCYFNNYSLSQPRHFCKTCRRYWTRGGALRNVPVGGGCHNKRSKGSGRSSKSSSTPSASSSSAATSVAGGAILSGMPPPLTPPPPPPPPPPPHLPFMASLHTMGDFGAANLGLNFSEIQPLDTAEYQVGSSSNVGLEQWRLPHIQQIPFLGGLEPIAPPPAPGLFPFDGERGYTGQVHQKQSSSSLITQLALVKMEDNSQVLSLPRQYLGIPGNDQYWNGRAGGSSTGSRWATDLYSSSTAGSLL